MHPEPISVHQHLFIDAVGFSSSFDRHYWLLVILLATYRRLVRPPVIGVVRKIRKTRCPFAGFVCCCAAFINRLLEISY
nr:MAG TPA: hypothetical protein [Caudoviricetes sp.]